MLKRTGNLFVMILWILAGVNLLYGGENPELSLSLNPASGLAVGEAFQLTLELTGSDPLELPDVSGALGDAFTVTYVGSGQMIRTRHVNGKTVTRRSLQFNWQIHPLKEGAYQIPALTVITETGPVTTLPISMRVAAARRSHFSFRIVPVKETCFAGEIAVLRAEFIFPPSVLEPMFRFEKGIVEWLPGVIGVRELPTEPVTGADGEVLYLKGLEILFKQDQPGKFTLDPVSVHVTSLGGGLFEQEGFGFPETTYLQSKEFSMLFKAAPEKLIGSEGTQLSVKVNPGRGYTGDSLSVTLEILGLDNPEKVDLDISDLQKGFGPSYIWEGPTEGVVLEDRVTFYLTAIPLEVPVQRGKGLEFRITDKNTGQVRILRQERLPVDVLSPVGSPGLSPEKGAQDPGASNDQIPIYTALQVRKENPLIPYGLVKKVLAILWVVPLLLAGIGSVWEFHDYCRSRNSLPSQRGKLLKALSRKKNKPTVPELYRSLISLKEAGFDGLDPLLGEMEQVIYRPQGVMDNRQFDKQVIEWLGHKESER